MRFLKLMGFERREVFDPLHPRDPALASWFGGGGMSSAGVSVTADSAMSSAAVAACVKVLSETIGQLPLILYKRKGDDGRERATKHRLYKILRRQPNSFQTAIEWKQMMQGHAALRGNGYSEIVSTGASAVEQLMPLHPDRVRPFWKSVGVRAYEYTPPKGPARIILQEEMFHLMGSPKPDGLSGMSTIEAYRNTIGLDLAQEAQAGRLLANGITPAGVLTAQKTLGQDGLKNLRSSIDEFHKGPDKAGRYMILEQGLQWTQLGMTMADAQFLEQRKFSRSQIASIFRIPPHLIGDLDRATFSNIEQQALEFVKFTMMPWATRWEEAISRDLLTESEKDVYFAEFLFDSLLRGDVSARYAAYTRGIQWGFLSVNDVRRMENMDPIDGGDVYLTPSNMIPTAGADLDQVLAQFKEMMNGKNP